MSSCNETEHAIQSARARDSAYIATLQVDGRLPKGVLLLKRCSAGVKCRRAPSAERRGAGVRGWMLVEGGQWRPHVAHVARALQEPGPSEPSGDALSQVTRPKLRPYPVAESLTQVQSLRPVAMFCSSQFARDCSNLSYSSFRLPFYPFFSLFPGSFPFFLSFFFPFFHFRYLCA